VFSHLLSGELTFTLRVFLTILPLTQTQSVATDASAKEPLRRGKSLLSRISLDLLFISDDEIVDGKGQIPLQRYHRRYIADLSPTRHLDMLRQRVP